MRLWYQYPAPLSPFRSVVFERVREAIDRARRPDTEVVIQPARRGAKSTALYAFELVGLLTAAEVVDRLREAEREGYDGAIIGQSLDPGLDIAKELLDIPVVGILEAAAHLAAMWGDRIGVVTIPPPPGYPPAKYQNYHRRNLERYGLGPKIAGFDHVRMPLPDLIAKIQASEHDAIVAEFHAAARRLQERGADAIIAGDTIISVILVHERALQVPETGQAIVDLITSGVKMAETLVDLRRALGIVRSRGGGFARPGESELREIAESFGVST
ncbi:MAG: aspartate/glutamate racemase family protein [Chloroflexota bacterium]|nr:aspartate/glutamate racemase family protein [Dehalococcoidia bacterium]MDW8253484.1 aspartate/glutamate racemase family protein [Chloroflexota bacterium]